MAARATPVTRAAQRVVPVDTEGMDPEMVETINTERHRKTKEKMVLAPGSVGKKRADFSGVKSGSSTTAPKPPMTASERDSLSAKYLDPYIAQDKKKGK